MRALLLVIGAGLLLSACATTPKAPPEPVVRTQIIKEPVPTPCPALNQLGVEPVYVDTDGALAAASGIDDRVTLLLTGRTQRQNRLREYGTARALCQAIH